MSATAWLDQLEAALGAHAAGAGASADHGEELIALALAAGQEVTVPEDELRGAVKRAMFVLAAGGDPHRGLALDGPAVATVARDLDSPFRRKALVVGLDELRVEAGGRTTIVEVIDALRDDEELAWRAFAAARMVKVISEDELADD
ncbi:MAG: hypothetical protein ACR2OD_12410 [Gaiellaceae bacterium]